MCAFVIGVNRFRQFNVFLGQGLRSIWISMCLGYGVFCQYCTLSIPLGEGEYDVGYGLFGRRSPLVTENSHSFWTLLLDRKIYNYACRL